MSSILGAIGFAGLLVFAGIFVWMMTRWAEDHKEGDQ